MLNTFTKIRNWANDRNLVMGSDSFRQTVKLVEEVGETAAAIARGNRAGIRDGIGDAVVVLTILAAQYGLLIEDCIDAAYEEIKDRKGKMVDGVFVKENETTPAPTPSPAEPPQVFDGRGTLDEGMRVPNREEG